MELRAYSQLPFSLDVCYSALAGFLVLFIGSDWPIPLGSYHIGNDSKCHEQTPLTHLNHLRRHPSAALTTPNTRTPEHPQKQEPLLDHV